MDTGTPRDSFFISSIAHRSDISREREELSELESRSTSDCKLFTTVRDWTRKSSARNEQSRSSKSSCRGYFSIYSFGGVVVADLGSKVQCIASVL